MIVSQRRVTITLLVRGEQIVVNGPGSNPQLEVDVGVNMSVSPTANSATVRILNLSRATRQSIAGRIKRSIDLTAAILKNEQDGISARLVGPPIQEVIVDRRGDAYVYVDAGYDNAGTHRIFQGASQLARHVKQGPTWSTEIHVGDGLSTMMAGVAAKTFPPKSFLKDVVRFTARVMGLGTTELDTTNMFELAMGSGKFTMDYGITCFGDARWFMSQLVDNFGVEWFVDRGEFYMVKKGAALKQPPVLVQWDNGLLNSPEPGEDGTVRIRCTIRADVRIGRLVKLRGVDYDGDYRVDNVMHRFNNRQGEAITEAFLAPLGGA